MESSYQNTNHCNWLYFHCDSPTTETCGTSQFCPQGPSGNTAPQWGVRRMRKQLAKVSLNDVLSCLYTEQNQYQPLDLLICSWAEAKMWKLSFPNDGFPFQTQLTLLPSRFGGLSTSLECKVEKGCAFPISLCLNLLRFLYKEITLIKSPFCYMKGARWLMLDFGWNWIWEKILTWNNTSSFYNPVLPESQLRTVISSSESVKPSNAAVNSRDTIHS